MAVDTRNRRAAVLSFMQPGRPPFPLADGTVDDIDRYQMLGVYGENLGLISFQPPMFILELASLDHILNLSPDDYILILEDSDHDLKIN